MTTEEKQGLLWFTIGGCSQSIIAGKAQQQETKQLVT